MRTVHEGPHFQHDEILLLQHVVELDVLPELLRRIEDARGDGVLHVEQHERVRTVHTLQRKGDSCIAAAMGTHAARGAHLADAMKGVSIS